jgi:tRNA(Glu) U13 pseudouridine synthase TruD
MLDVQELVPVVKHYMTRVPLADASVEAVDGGLRLCFALPQGSFATSVLRELLTEMPWFG